MEMDKENRGNRMSRINLVSRIACALWMSVFCVVLIICSLGESPVLIDGSVRTTCFGMFGMLILLGVLILLCGDETPAYVRMLAGSGAPACDKETFGQKAAASGARRHSRLSAMRQLALSLLSAALYWYYCFRLDGVFSTNIKTDALVAGGLICASVVLGRNARRE